MNITVKSKLGKKIFNKKESENLWAYVAIYCHLSKNIIYLYSETISLTVEMKIICAVERSKGI